MSTPGETHDDRCCMNGIPPGKGPHPDCPGVEALQAEYLEIKRRAVPEPVRNPLLEPVAEEPAWASCTWCRECGSCDAGLPMSCTCGTCTCTEPCGHPRCGDAGEHEVPIGVDASGETIYWAWSQPVQALKDQASWALPGKSVLPDLIEMAAEAEKGHPGEDA